MITDWELWACAAQVLQQHGPDARAHTEARAAALHVAGDAEGVRTWRAIATRIAQLADISGPSDARH